MALNGTSKACIVFETLKDDILGGRIEPNERLVERDLVERFGVSKTPVREALSMLRNEGLAKGRYYRGMTAVHLSANRLRELFEVREVLEGLAARCTAYRVNAELVDGLSANLAAQEAALNSDRWYELTPQFHNIILDHCGNSSLTTTLGRLYDQHRVLTIGRMSPLLNQPRARNIYVLREHKDIFAAIREGDGYEAEERTRQHVRSAFERLSQPNRQDGYYVEDAATI
ncbi:GntR family transcriptional regulator [Chloroflexota bacterium]